MRKQLLLLLSELKTPELCLILETNPDNSYSWKRFGKPSKTQKSKHRTSVEETVVHIYLAYLTQMCQSKVFTAGGSLVARDARHVLCPKAFLDYLEHPKSRTMSLEKIIGTANVVCLEPGIWQNRGKVLKWQAHLAVWRKHGKRFEPISTQVVEHLPDYSNLPPAYSELPPDSENSSQDILVEL